MGVGVDLNFVNPASLLLGEIDLEAREQMTIDLYKSPKHFGRHEAYIPNSVP